MKYTIPDIKKALDDYKNLKRQLNKKRSKLKALFEQYKFAEDIVNSNCKSRELETALVKLFNDIGFKAKQPKNQRDLDIFIQTRINLLGIEVKGGSTLRENEIFQVHKYAQRIRNEKPEWSIHPILIWNNAKNKNDFDQYMIKDALLNEYSLMTTLELQKGFILVKQNKITKDL